MCNTQHKECEELTPEEHVGPPSYPQMNKQWEEKELQQLWQVLGKMADISLSLVMKTLIPSH